MPDSVPQDWRDLLIRLDQRVSDGFDTMNKRFDAYDRRADALERRVGEIESTLADRPLYIGQHNALITRVNDLERARDRVDTTVKVVQWIFGGQLVALVGGIIAFAKAMHAI
ncbi:hypothetical protein [Sphingomonas aracearum]|uniref:Uncharacterized protein n=1 Tax=Sphingomonas aracearum TaxID=2283317 RepID=A0A369W0H6_9SPHN|nr:hypothetical protein [Sphingomonas aracearum]RDE06802.1 hypothetical protein DVW87_03715 [Sphingomonas aracearum]